MIMSPMDNILAGESTGKNESQNFTTRKPSAARHQEPPLKCPRCDSPNTKFCYYNNYNLTQPRHFCKTCRRYWTKGGALRNVPIGGGCRKNKKIKSSPRLSGYFKDSSGSSDGGGLKLFKGLSPVMDFQQGGINIPRLHSTNPGIFNQFASFGDLSANSAGISTKPCFSIDHSGISSPLLGFSFPLSSSPNQGDETLSGFQEMGSMNIHSNIASSIESLSSINQDLHWKLQKQRLETLFIEDNKNENRSIQSGTIEPLIQKPQPTLFQNLENSNTKYCCINGNSRKDGANGNLSTELFFNISNATVDPDPTTSNSNNLNDNTSNWSGIQAWSELTQYSSLP